MRDMPAHWIILYSKYLLHMSMNPAGLLRLSLFVILSAQAVACHDRPGADTGRPVSPAGTSGPVLPGDALSTFELEPGFKIELLASEPLVADPVDMEIDEYGRLYVVEMHGYPLDKSGSGVIKILSDTDGDGKMDKSTVFADGLVLPNSIMRWKKGLLVTDAPNVLYLEDTNGDGKADIRDTLLTGFALSNPQHNLNSPLLAMDNWIYLAHEGAVATQTYTKEFGDQGTEIYFPAQPKAPRLAKNASGRSVRFQPDSHLLETTSSNTQFGHAFDAWGHHLLVSNSNHIFQEVIAAPYLKRNPHLLAPDATQSLSDHNDAAEVFPITKNPERQLLTDIGVITSACGLTDYQGGIFPAPYDQASFVAEPVSNLVHVDKLTDKGASFVASRIRPNKEFLASTDAWFRPVNMYVGPDGALYVVDYYREIIEHPEWMGEDVVKSGRLYNGHDRGRIYRISPQNAGGPDWTKGLALGDAPVEKLVEQLANTNGWWRGNAQRLLVDRHDKNSVAPLVRMADNPVSPQGRLHALWALEGLHELKPGLIEKALKDPVPGIRENAIKLAELHLPDTPGLATALLSLRDDAGAKVRFQLLCTLGSVNSPAARKVSNALLFKDIDDQWVQMAALSASSSQTSTLLDAVLDHYRSEGLAWSSLTERLSAMIGAGESPAMIHRLIEKALSRGAGRLTGWPSPLLEGLAQGLKAKKSRASLSPGDESAMVSAFFDDSSERLREAAFDVLKAIDIKNKPLLKKSIGKAVQSAGDPHQPDNKRVEAIGFLALVNPVDQTALLEGLISPREPSSIQTAALRTLSEVPGKAVSLYLLKQWSGLTPEIQDAAMNTFLLSEERISLLLDAIEGDKVNPASVGWERSVGLMAQPNLVLRAKARMLLTKSDAESIKVNATYQQALTLKGDPEKGRAVYLRNCSKCHQVRGGSGIKFGPDLGTIHNWSAEAIMANILSPNLSISSGYDLWAVELNNGQSFQGIISSESATAITMTNAGREVRTINRSDIKSLKAQNMSSMPPGLEKQIDQQQMADLLAFLKQNK